MAAMAVRVLKVQKTAEAIVQEPALATAVPVQAVPAHKHNMEV